MLNTSCTVEEKVLVHLNPVTKGGRPAKLDGPIVVSVQSGEGTFEVQPDGLSFFAISPDVPGETVYLVDGDADLGAGVIDIQDNVTLTATGVNAAALGLTADAPVSK